MLFNSLVFILLFLPVSLAGYFALAASPLRPWRFAFISLMSMVFYAYASWSFAVLLAASTATNLVLAKVVEHQRNAGRERTKKALVVTGLIANLAFLAYFKYVDFFITNINAATGLDIPLLRVALPIGISFYTFIFMATLVDVARRRIEHVKASHFVSFSLFYPHLLAGPLVHYGELVPQIARKPSVRRIPAHVVIGLCIFAIGLFKKTVLADTFAAYANPIFNAADAGAAPATAAGWLAALSFTLQIYFDFSGYSDMAIGLARMFGFKLPLNFHSPLKARSITEYWRRWHMTLNRIIVAYLFPPMAMAFTRWSMEKRLGEWAAFFVSVVLPTFIVFFVVGFWHGAGWNYIWFGFLHGFNIAVCEAWRKVRKSKRWRKTPIGRPEIIVAHVLTLGAVIIAHTVFRANTMDGALSIFSSMLTVGAGPYVEPAAPILGYLPNLIVVVLGYLFVFLAPNTQQIMRRYSPALDWDKWQKVAPAPIKLTFRPTIGWAIYFGIVLFLGVVFIMRAQTEFIYFQF